MFYFNNQDSTDFLIENKVRHSLLPQLEKRTLTVAGRPGFYDFGSRLGGREIQVDVTIKESSSLMLRQKARDIASWLYHQEVKPLLFSDEPDKHYFARVDGKTDIDEIVGLGQGTITFLCPDPFAYGAIKTVPLHAGPITNEGSYDTYPVITLQFQQATSQLRIRSGDKQVLLVHPFQQGQELVVDHNRAVVKLNDLRIMNSLYLSSEFFPIYKGDNWITLEPANIATATVQFREKWL
ncbi:distal tail protein Dit [Heliorestis convoluta]|uniref:Phage tail protein n=1 Tax=Heliorestis convoluta TaxID=356322 RepID=A0A5Q2MYE2_9FIRM|nr:distal tail protein Dit [Heliorestis convoluta]QGG47657.1 Phage tail protein [Heliorestis convoluta]